MLGFYYHLKQCGRKQPDLPKQTSMRKSTSPSLALFYLFLSWWLQFRKDGQFRPQSPPRPLGYKPVMAKALSLLPFTDFTNLRNSVTHAGEKCHIGSDYSPAPEQPSIKLSYKNKASDNWKMNKIPAGFQPKELQSGVHYFGAWKWGKGGESKYTGKQKWYKKLKMRKEKASARLRTRWRDSPTIRGTEPCHK